MKSICSAPSTASPPRAAGAVIGILRNLAADPFPIALQMHDGPGVILAFAANHFLEPKAFHELPLDKHLPFVTVTGLGGLCILRIAFGNARMLPGDTIPKPLEALAEAGGTVPDLKGAPLLVMVIESAAGRPVALHHGAALFHARSLPIFQKRKLNLRATFHILRQ
ncbi:hypothetical protein [Xanthobacter autotrophicus]|uniref:hypothetical protein n=1 Tax=Xanthobacter autotrophicus TaxID=280 RepID=UPI00372B0E0C